MDTPAATPAAAPVDDKKPFQCPNCGCEGNEDDDGGIYARADIKWCPVTQSWEISHIENGLDCTACDHNWNDDTIGAA